MTAASADPRPLIAHIVYRFDTGGLENGVVNLVNRLPREKWRHAIIALTTITEFRRRIERDDVQFIALEKLPGHGARLYPKMTRLLRTLRPAIVHTRNLAALEMVVPAWWARVPVRIHGEHGREGADLAGASPKYDWIRKAYRPFVHHYVALSRNLEQYLLDVVKVPQGRVSRITNGVDVDRFSPRGDVRVAVPGWPFADALHWIVGTVGRMQPVKDQLCLAQAFVKVLGRAPELKDRLRLVLVGDGPLRIDAETILRSARLEELAWMPGMREDAPDILRSLDCFVLPSRSEGISNTILEAMSSGLPVIATAVGGNPELVEAGQTGELVPAADPEALAQAIVAYARNPAAARAAGRAGRERVEASYSLAGMVARYDALYSRLLAKAQVGAASAAVRSSPATATIAPEAAPITTTASNCASIASTHAAPVGTSSASMAMHRAEAVVADATPIAPRGAPPTANCN